MSEKLHNVHRAQESLASAMNRQNSARQQDVEIIMKVRPSHKSYHLS